MTLEMVTLAVALLLVPVFAKYAAWKAKGLPLIAGAGILFLLAEGFAVFGVAGEQLSSWGALLFQLIGGIFILVGAILAAIDLGRSVF